MWFTLLLRCPSWRPINPGGFFSRILARIPQGMQKYSEGTCLYCSAFFRFWTFYAGIGGINKVLGFLIVLVFQSRMLGISFVVNARSSLAICRAIQSQSCLLLKQFWRRYCNWDFGKQFWIFLCACSQRAVDNFNFRTEDLLTDLFIDKEDFGWGITTITTKEI